mmetsp:Transcript_8667/g.28486  ORF Transcript_8667/g.28486 Transcript_8667/m.28486 type:complete len:93 (-) Transcript_8667:131-409(-)
MGEERTIRATLAEVGFEDVDIFRLESGLWLAADDVISDNNFDFMLKAPMSSVDPLRAAPPDTLAVGCSQNPTLRPKPSTPHPPSGQPPTWKD